MVRFRHGFAVAFFGDGVYGADVNQTLYPMALAQRNDIFRAGDVYILYALLEFRGDGNDASGMDNRGFPGAETDEQFFQGGGIPHVPFHNGSW